MPDVLRNLVRSVVGNTATAYITAGAAEVVTIKRVRILNNSAAACTLVGLWVGAVADDAHAEALDIDLNPGESLEWDPTLMVLNNNEKLFAQGSVASALTLHADGLSQS